MKKKSKGYLVTAKCGNDRCHTNEFTRVRLEIDKVNSGGRKYRIENLVCPECRQWAEITEIKPVTKA